MNNDKSQLPILPKEKIGRWLTHGGIAVALAFGLNAVLPTIVSALKLVVTGVWTMTELAVAAGVLTGTLVLGKALWPVYKKLVESLANKATWALFEWDPITPMELWIEKEVIPDHQRICEAYQEIDGVVASIEHKVTDLQQKAEKANGRLKAAVKQYGQDSHQARMASVDVSTPRRAAKEMRQSIAPLETLRGMLKKVSEVTEFTLHEARAQVSAAKIQWQAAQESESATNAATRVLHGKSRRSLDAEKSMELIRQRYSAQFGRMRALRQLADSTFNRVDLEKGALHMDALKALQAESTQLLLEQETAPVSIQPRIRETDKSSLYR